MANQTTTQANGSDINNRFVTTANGAANGTQFVTVRDGKVVYDQVDPTQSAGLLGSASNNTYKNTLTLNKGLLEGYDNSAKGRSDVYVANKGADANYLLAQAEYKKAMGSGGSGTDSFFQDIRNGNDKLAAERQRTFNQYRDDVTAYKNKEYNAGQAAANRDLDKYVANIDLDKTRVNAGSQVEQARIQQPLSAGQILDKTRIENPDPMKSMAMNLLGGYSAGNGARSNFSYWG